MELTAAIKALQTLKEPCQVRLVTDSEYLREGITKWLAGWKAKGWMKTLKRTVRNDDLWRALDQAAARHAIQWEWVQGHSGHTENERCDQLAQAEVASIKQRFSALELERLLDQFRASHSAQKDQPRLL
jgi:ribonuclease HI